MHSISMIFMFESKLRNTYFFAFSLVFTGDGTSLSCFMGDGTRQDENVSFFEPHVSFLFYGTQEAENVRLSRGKQDARGRERDVIQTSHSLSCFMRDGM
jgi:hypothetical protein